MSHLPTNPAHLGRNATASVEPAFTDESWYAAYTARHAAHGVEGRLGRHPAFPPLPIRAICPA